MIRLAAIAIAIAFGGCAADRAGRPDAAVRPAAPADMAKQPAGCAHTFTLVGDVTPAPQKIGPVAIDQTGFNVCLVLDATHLGRAHFMGGTGYESGMASSFVATLERADDRSILQNGWDVTVDDTPQPRTMVNLEWSPPAGQVTNAILWVRARGTTATTSVDFALFDPLE